MSRGNGGLKARIGVAAVLIVPLYVIPAIARLTLYRAGFPFLAIFLADLLGAACVAFITNNLRFGVLLYLGFTALELTVAAVTQRPMAAFWVGDIGPAIIAIYFGQRLYVTMGA